MLNSREKKIGNAAGIADATIIVGTQTIQKEKELEAVGKIGRPTLADNFIVIKAYDGGNPNKAKSNNEKTH